MKKNYFLTLLSFLVLYTTSNAQVPVMTSLSGPASVCSAPSPASNYNATASNAPTSYSWTVSPSAGVIISNPTSANATISFPYSNTTYTVYCTASNGSGTSAPLQYVISVFQTPTVTFSGATAFCQGSFTNLQASSTIIPGSSTIGYNWAPSSGLNTTTGPNVTASPSVTTTYTVIATIGSCTNTSQIVINPKPTPTITVNSYIVDLCSGNSTTLTASGATSYTWTGGITNGVGFTPLTSGYFQVTGQNSIGCRDSVGVIVNVNSNPTVSAMASSTTICKGLTTTLTLSGSVNTFSVNSIASNSLAVVSPTISKTYTISGTDFFGCKGTATIDIVVLPCVGIKENLIENTNLTVFPNPNNGTFNISSQLNEKAIIINDVGQVIQTLNLYAGKKEQINDLSSGIYFILTPTSRNKVIILK